MLCLLIVFTRDEEALSRPSFYSSRTWQNLSWSLSHISYLCSPLRIQLWPEGRFPKSCLCKNAQAWQVALLGTQAQPPLLNSIRSHKPGSLPPLGVGPRLWTSVFSWLGWEPGLCQPAVTILKNYFALRCFSCHFPKAPSAPPGDHYFPSLKIPWDGLWIQPVHLPFSVLSQVERWNYSPLVLWPAIFKTKIRSYPALFVLWLLELFCFALFYLNLCFFSFLKC